MSKFKHLDKLLSDAMDPKLKKKMSRSSKKPAKRAAKKPAKKAAKGSSKKITKKVGGRSASAQLTPLKKEYIVNGRGEYTPQSLRASLSKSEINKEYSRLRSIAQKRLARLSKSKFKGSTTFKYYDNFFKKIKDLEGGVSYEMLTELNRFLQGPMSTIKGQNAIRNQRIETLRKYGYEVSDENFDKLTDVLDYLRDTYQDLFYDSDALITEAIDSINKIINDPSINLNSLSREEIAEDVYNRYAASSADLWRLNI